MLLPSRVYAILILLRCALWHEGQVCPSRYRYSLGIVLKVLGIVSFIVSLV